MVVYDSKTDTPKLEEDELRFVRNLIDGWSPSSVSVPGETLVSLHAAMLSHLARFSVVIDDPSSNSSMGKARAALIDLIDEALDFLVELDAKEDEVKVRLKEDMTGILFYSALPIGRVVNIENEYAILVCGVASLTSRAMGQSGSEYLLQDRQNLYRIVSLAVSLLVLRQSPLSSLRQEEG